MTSCEGYLANFSEPLHPNFRECPKGEVRRIYIPGTSSVYKGTMITMVMATTISRIMILAMVTRITTIGHKDAPVDNR